MWDKYQKAFQELDKRRPYQTVSYEYGVFSKEFLEHLKNIDIWLKYKIRVWIGTGFDAREGYIKLDKWMDYFNEFLEYCETNDYSILFDDIVFDYYHWYTSHIQPIYTSLRKQGFHQERLLLRYWSIYGLWHSSSICTLRIKSEDSEIDGINHALESELDDTSKILKTSDDDKIDSEEFDTDESDSDEFYYHLDLAFEPFKTTSIRLQKAINFIKYGKTLPESTLWKRLTEMTIEWPEL